MSRRRGCCSTAPFQPPCRRDFTGKALVDDADVGEPAQQGPELAGAVLPDDRGVLVLEPDLHDAGQRVEPGDAVVDLEEGRAARLEHPPALLDQRPVAGRVLHDAVGEDEVERVVVERQALAVADAERRRERLVPQVLPGEGDGRVGDVDARRRRRRPWRTARGRRPPRTRRRAPGGRHRPSKSTRSSRWCSLSK
ncbi:MAG: hypothetical protein MZV64_73530 [Ignavibacteriales bacterium]|nr:hypothetical protein [Ignavibacteriales bacterium]